MWCFEVLKVPVPANWKRQLTCLQIAQFSLMLPFGIAFVGKALWQRWCDCFAMWADIENCRPHSYEPSLEHDMVPDIGQPHVNSYRR